jgi:hypothetical protein
MRPERRFERRNGTGGCDAAVAPKTQIPTRPGLTYCRPNLVLTKGSTLSGLQLPVIRQTTLHIGDLVLTEADLERAFAGIADREDGYGVTFAAVAPGAAGAVTDEALEQGAAEDVAGAGEARGKATAFADGPRLFHY